MLDSTKLLLKEYKANPGSLFADMMDIELPYPADRDGSSSSGEEDDGVASHVRVKPMVGSFIQSEDAIFFSGSGKSLLNPIRKSNSL